MSKDLAIIICPPYPKYKSAPKDQSHCELVNCPKCTSKMWISEKKKRVFTLYSGLGKEILLGCYECIKKEIEKDPSLILDSKKVDL